MGMVVIIGDSDDGDGDDGCSCGTGGDDLMMSVWP